MADVYRFSYCKPIPVGDWNAFDQLIINLIQLESELSWEDYQLTDKETMAILTHKDYKAYE